jgi:predicted NAD-dependent protein-ADP-ribosyltransferase YbiA (DUF1768 family)
MDIKSGCGYPACALSNFAPHPFVIDGIQASSMEGFLQGLKFSNPEMQKHVCTLVGFQAKSFGRGKNWQRTQTLYWNGQEIKRDSEAYQELLDRAYDQLSQNDGFRKALLATCNATLEHSIGRTNPKDTVLTRKEFCSRLMKIRAKLKENSK